MNQGNILLRLRLHKSKRHFTVPAPQHTAFTISLNNQKLRLRNTAFPISLNNQKLRLRYIAFPFP
jgi:hypothetical protein